MKGRRSKYDRDEKFKEREMLLREKALLAKTVLGDATSQVGGLREVTATATSADTLNRILTLCLIVLSVFGALYLFRAYENEAVPVTIAPSPSPTLLPTANPVVPTLLPTANPVVPTSTPSFTPTFSPILTTNAPSANPTVFKVCNLCRDGGGKGLCPA